jgi:uncharacterized membrane protein
MSVKIQWLAIASIVAMGTVSALLIVSLSGFRGSAGGDLAVSSAPGIWTSPMILLAGVLILLCLSLVHVVRRRQRLAPGQAADA